MTPKTTKNNENNEKGGATKNRARRFLRYQMMIVAVCHRQPRAPLEGRRTPRGAAPLEGRRTPEGVAHPGRGGAPRKGCGRGAGPARRAPHRAIGPMAALPRHEHILGVLMTSPKFMSTGHEHILCVLMDGYK